MRKFFKNIKGRVSTFLEEHNKMIIERDYLNYLVKDLINEYIDYANGEPILSMFTDHKKSTMYLNLENGISICSVFSARGYYEIEYRVNEDIDGEKYQAFYTYKKAIEALEHR